MWGLLARPEAQLQIRYRLARSGSSADPASEECLERFSFPPGRALLAALQAACLVYFESFGTFSGGGSIATLSLAPGMFGIAAGSGKAASEMSFRSFLRSFWASIE